MFTPRTPAEETVLAFFTALGSEDWDRTRALMTDAVEWTVMVRGVPGEGVHRGADAIFAVIRPVRALFEPGSPQLTLRALTSAGSRVIMETHGGGQLKDGRTYDNNYVMVVEVQDGRVAALREYMDSYYVNGLMGAG